MWWRGGGCNGIIYNPKGKQEKNKWVRNDQVESLTLYQRMLILQALEMKTILIFGGSSSIIDEVRRVDLGSLYSLCKIVPRIKEFIPCFKSIDVIHILHSCNTHVDAWWIKWSIEIRRPWLKMGVTPRFINTMNYNIRINMQWRFKDKWKWEIPKEVQVFKPPLPPYSRHTSTFIDVVGATIIIKCGNTM